MTAISVSYGDDSDYRAFVYGAERAPGTIEFMKSTFNNISNTLTSGGREFFSNAKDIFEEYNGSRALQLAKAALSKMNNAFVRNDVHSIWDIDKFQNAPIVMQRWIMAEPTVRQKFHEQQCDGYSNQYVDVSPGEIGESHYDYRRVMNGMVVTSDDGPEKVTHYLDELEEGDRELRFDEQLDILNTWERVAFLMNAGGDDPTSSWGGSL